MKVLWLCDILLPYFAEEFKQPAPPYGGWITGLLEKLRLNKDLEITICMLADELKNGEVNGIKYWSYKQDNNNIPLFKKVIETLNPDIIHIW